MSTLQRYTFLLAALALIAAPLSASAAESWSAVTVNQEQSAWSPNSKATLTQSASAVATTSLDTQAYATSSSSAAQRLEFTGKGSQTQQLDNAAALKWATNKWPQTATSSTSAAIDQSQKAWSDKSIKADQDAGFWLRNKVGSNTSSVDIGLNQKSHGATGDVKQKQSSAGQAHTEGYVNVPQPTCSWCGKHVSTSGGSLFQRVNVVVDNLFSF